MNLHSPIFDTIRIPSRTTVARLANQVAREYGIEPESLRNNRKRYASDTFLAARCEFLRRARAAKFPYCHIGDWFGHRDGTTVKEWCLDAGG